MEPPVTVQVLLGNSRPPVSELTVRAELYGLFSLPEHWKPADSEPPEHYYQVSFLGATFTSDKFRKRQLTEEELQAAEEAKKPKKDAGKKKNESEPTAEELEELERRRLEQLEEARVAQEQWDALDGVTQFYLTYENEYKHPAVLWGGPEESSAPAVLRV